MYTIKDKPLNELPPTSLQIKEQLKRSYYVIRLNTMLLCYDQFDLKPCMFGWKCIDAINISEKGHVHMPGYYNITCQHLSTPL